MAKKKGIGLLAAALLLAAVPTRSETLFFDDFSSWLEGDADGKFEPVTGVENLNTTTNVWVRNNSGCFISSTGTTVTGTGQIPPSDSSNGAAMRVGFSGTNARNVGINTGLAFNVNSNYTFSCSATILEGSGNTAADATAYGQIKVIIGFLETNGDFTALKDNIISDLSATSWTTNSVTVNGSRIREAAIGAPITLKLARTSTENSSNYYTWVEWAQLEAVNPYDEYIQAYGLSGTNALMTADPDGDGVDNMYEWAIGGDPTNPAISGLSGPAYVADVNGTNRFFYITPQQVDNRPNGIDYYLESTTDLISGSWTNAGATKEGVSDAGFNADFDAVTNSVGGVESQDKQFLRLRVTYPGYNP